MIEQNVGNICFKWWTDLANYKRDWATLRHCKTIDEIYFQPAYIELVSRFDKVRENIPPETTLYPNEEDSKIKLLLQLSSPKQIVSNLPVIAATLAHVKSHNESNKFATQLALSNIKAYNVRKLLACREQSTLLNCLVHIVKQLPSVNISDLSEVIEKWNRLKTKRQLAFIYFSISNTMTNK